MSESITIRQSTEADRREIWRLAQLDDRATPRGPALLGYEGGELRAALPVNGGHAVADPFHLTDELVELLRLSRQAA